MKVVGLISGGKDSMFNLVYCAHHGHELVALANLCPPTGQDEMDSYMYQTVGHDIIPLYADCLDVPLIRHTIQGKSIAQDNAYETTDQDEVEDLFILLEKVKKKVHDIEAVSVGAILSNYQRLRVEQVCSRLGLMVLSYLWQREQKELLNEMIMCRMECILIKVAALGLNESHLGKTLGDMQPTLLKLNEKYDLHPCGEGGEYETLTLDCPLFLKKRIVIKEQKVVIHANDAFATVSFLKITRAELVDKSCYNNNGDDEIKNSWRDELQKDEFKNYFDYNTNISSTLRNFHQSKHHTTANIIKDIQTNHKNTKLDSKYHTQLFLFPSISNLNCSDTNSLELENQVLDVMSKLNKYLSEHKLTFKHVVASTILVKDMNQFSILNSIYKQSFGIYPPARVTVQVSLNDPYKVAMEFIIYKYDVTKKRCLHVQGISYWAAANIGPYSQVIGVDGNLYVAGQIGLVPSSMQLPHQIEKTCDVDVTETNAVFGSSLIEKANKRFIEEANVSLHNLNAILNMMEIKRMQQNGKSDLIGCIVFLTSWQDGVLATHAWENFVNHKPNIKDNLIRVVVPALPRFALVEWQAIVYDSKQFFEPNDSSDDEEEDYNIEERNDVDHRISSSLFRQLKLNDQALNRSSIDVDSESNMKIALELCFRKQQAYVMGTISFQAHDDDDIKNGCKQSEDQIINPYLVITKCYLEKAHSILKTMIDAEFSDVQHEKLSQTVYYSENMFMGMLLDELYETFNNEGSFVPVSSINENSAQLALVMRFKII